MAGERRDLMLRGKRNNSKALDAGQRRMAFAIALIFFAIALAFTRLIYAPNPDGVPQGLIAFGLTGAALLGLVLRDRTKLLFTLYLAALCLIPYWLQVKWLVIFPPTTIAFIVALPAALKYRQKLNRSDKLILVILVCAVVSVALFRSPPYALGTLCAEWLPAYLIGRWLAPAVGWDYSARTIAFFGTLTGLWSCVEFVFHWHVFSDLQGRPDVSFWNAIQTREGYERSEAAFGHSIALGGFLSLCIPFVLTARMNLPLRVAATATVLAGTIFTFSRGALIGVFFCLVLTPIAVKRLIHASWRAVYFTAATGAAAILAPAIIDWFNSASDTEASAGYRLDLLSTVFQDVRPFGLAAQTSQLDDGTYLYKGTSSIDNGFLLEAITLGWIPAVLIMTALIFIAWRVLRHGGAPAQIALLGTALVLTTVAPITQFGVAAWLCAGIVGSPSSLWQTPLGVGGNSSIGLGQRSSTDNILLELS